MIPPRLILATANAGKVVELSRLARAWGVHDVGSLADVPALELPEENGTTYLDNALLKARAVAAATRLPALADDSGLEVDALGGAPGVGSARFAPTDARRVARLLDALRGVVDRRARFRAVVVLVWPDGRAQHAEGVCEGRIAEVPAGSGGFGYDPVFVPDALGRTFAEAAAADKERVSHRARAMRALGGILGV